jgi:hypothetical protein
MLSLAEKSKQIEQLEELEDEVRHSLMAQWGRDLDQFLALELEEGDQAAIELAMSAGREGDEASGCAHQLNSSAVFPARLTNIQQWSYEFHANSCAKFFKSQLAKDKRQQEAKEKFPLPKRVQRPTWDAEEEKAQKLRHQLRMKYVLHLDEVAKQEVEAERMRTVLNMLPSMVSNTQGRRKS